MLTLYAPTAMVVASSWTLLAGTGLLAGLLAVPLVAVGILAYLVFARVEGQYFESGGASIHYTVEGSGEPVILVHGLAANADINWRRSGMIRKLRSDFRVVAFDCRGHGLSEKFYDPKDYGIEMVNDIVRLIDHLDIDKAHVAGYSMGGFIVLKLMTTYPERLRSAAICAAGWRKPDDTSEILSPFRPPPEAHLETRHLLASTLPLFASRGPVNWARDWVGRNISDKEARKACRRSFSDVLVTEEELRACTVPAICFIGSKDGLKPYADNLVGVLPDLEFVVLDGATHLSTPINRDFKNRLRDFFLRHRGG